MLGGDPQRAARVEMQRVDVPRLGRFAGHALHQPAVAILQHLAVVSSNPHRPIRRFGDGDDLFRHEAISRRKRVVCAQMEIAQMEAPHGFAAPANPHVAAAGAIEGPHRLNRSIQQSDRRGAVGRELIESGERADPDIVVTVREDIARVNRGRCFRRSKNAGLAREHSHETIPAIGAPDCSRGILADGGAVVIREAAGGIEQSEIFRPQPLDAAAIHRQPEVRLHILADGSHLIVVGGHRNRLPVHQTEQPLPTGAEPQNPRAVLQHVLDGGGAWQPRRLVAHDRQPVVLPFQQPLTRCDPDPTRARRCNDDGRLGVHRHRNQSPLAIPAEKIPARNPGAPVSIDGKTRPAICVPHDVMFRSA